ncbi:IS110 family transposase [Massilia sp. Root335]|uniref:IS110 family transposase n=1 Tax=Massilia sp. Root335 TaxID=1736517 RepID=UPI0006F1E266|nr:IS110 family transposase [Massilia sp. Root335]KQV52164.1 transposase [Massilia sp. Root335]
MSTFVGIDIAKEIHWACAVDSVGRVVLNRKVMNTPVDLTLLVEELSKLAQPCRVGIDVLGGIAAFAQAVLLHAGVELVHIPGLAVNRARQGTVGGEAKSDPRDARVIADQVRTRSDLRPVVAETELDIEIRLLVSHRADLTQEQTRRIARMHDLLVGIFPELEHRIDMTTKMGLRLLACAVTPEEFRTLSLSDLLTALGSTGKRTCGQELAMAARAAALRQATVVPGSRTVGRLIKELAEESLAAVARLDRIDGELEELLRRHPDAALIRSLPGMGAIMTAEFIAEVGQISRFRSGDALAAAAGLAPVLKQSGKTRWLKRPLGGNKGLKRVFYQSAFASLRCPASRQFYDRKRREGKRHHQAIIALARRRVNVLWAMLTYRRPFDPTPTEFA